MIKKVIFFALILQGSAFADVLPTSDASDLSDDQLRCERAIDLGRREGEFIFKKGLIGQEKADLCEELKLDKETYWLRSHSLKNLAWDLGRFKPLAGLEEFQECRNQGQNSAIENANQELMKDCENELEENVQPEPSN